MAKNGGAGGRPKGNPPKHTAPRKSSALFDDISELAIQEVIAEQPAINPADLLENPELAPLLIALEKIDLIIDSHISVELWHKLIEIKEHIHSYMDDLGDKSGDGDIAETIRDVLVRNASKINGWLTLIGNKDPLKALTLFKDLAEYIIPKIQRAGGGGVNEPQIVINFESTEGHKKRLANTKKETEQ